MAPLATHLARLIIAIALIGCVLGRPTRHDPVAQTRLPRDVVGSTTSSEDVAIPRYRLYPNCRHQADICDAWDDWEICRPGKAKITTEDWQICPYGYGRPRPANVLSDPFNCGECGNICAGKPTYCVSGVCRPSPPVTINLRIEGPDEDGTLFEGKVATSGRWMTSASGQYGRCDATDFYTGRNVSSGTITTALDDAGRLNGFSWDGYYWEHLERYDFGVNRIGGRTEANDTAWWGLHNGSQYPAEPTYCMTPAVPSDEYVWAYAPKQGPSILRLAGPSTSRLGDPVTYTVYGTNVLLGESETPVAGAEVRGRLTDANGTVTLTYTRPCQFFAKATKQGYIRSNAVWTQVVSV